jgi:hypothetical protein
VHRDVLRHRTALGLKSHRGRAEPARSGALNR